MRFYLPNEDHLPVVNHARKQMSVVVNNLVAVGDTKKGRSLVVNHAKMVRRKLIEETRIKKENIDTHRMICYLYKPS